MIRVKDQLVFSVCFLVLSGVVNAEICPAGQVERKLESQDETICCQPYFNCGPGSEIVSCTGPENNKDLCVPCAVNKTSYHFTSSIDESWTKYRCFVKETLAHSQCPPEDTKPTAKNMFENCALSCECDVSKCYYGNPCGCEKSEPCTVGNELNATSKECNPCKEHMYKDKADCLPCMWNETSWRLSQVADEPAAEYDDPSDVNAGITNTPNEVKTTDAKYVIETGDKEPATSPENGSDEGGAPVVLIIVIIMFVVLGAVLIALVLFLEKKIRDGHHDSRVVVCYKKIRCGKNDLQQPLDDNVELGQGDGNNEDKPVNKGDVVEEKVVLENNDDVQEKPQQAVTPMLQETTPVPIQAESIPSAEISLNVANETDDSCVPLMSPETNGDATAHATEEKSS